MWNQTEMKKCFLNLKHISMFQFQNLLHWLFCLLSSHWTRWKSAVKTMTKWYRRGHSGYKVLEREFNFQKINYWIGFFFFFLNVFEGILNFIQIKYYLLMINIFIFIFCIIFYLKNLKFEEKLYGRIPTCFQSLTPVRV